MDEIKVVPYIPDEDYDNPAMVVDFTNYYVQLPFPARIQGYYTGVRYVLPQEPG